MGHNNGQWSVNLIFQWVSNYERLDITFGSGSEQPIRDKTYCTAFILKYVRGN